MILNSRRKLWGTENQLIYMIDSRQKSINKIKIILTKTVGKSKIMRKPYWE